MNDDQLLRYSRHIMLPEIDVAGQEALLAARVLVVGLGGLGAPVAMYLAASGVGSLTLVDDDEVELSNLQRQIIHTTERIGQTKVASAITALRQLNSDCSVTGVEERLTADGLRALLPHIDLVLDGTDNFATRHLINAACREHRVPLVSGAAIRWEGQLAVFDFRDPDAPCYACLYPITADDADMTCATNGILAPVVGVIGALQALEAVKVLTATGDTLSGYLLVMDAKRQQWQRLRLSRNPRCSVCGTSAESAD